MDEVRFSPWAFDRRYAFIPVLAMVALIVTTYFVVEERRAYVANLSVQIQESQDKIVRLAT